jgi:hypothetical protein
VNIVMVIVFIKAMQVGRAHGYRWPRAGGAGRPEPSRHPGRLRNGNKDKPQCALMTVVDLRQLNQFYFYARAQDSAQGTGVCGGIAIGCGRQRLKLFAGPGKAICGH